MIKINVGIQARLGSNRLPEKILLKINQKSILEHVVDSVKKTQRYINRNQKFHDMNVDISLLVPNDDINALPVVENVNVIGGDEKDVLSRYIKLIDHDRDIDYVVRITADCPLLPPTYIHKVIVTAVHGKYDYVSNAIPQLRTTWDGSDVEIITPKLLRWLNASISDSFLREHVTLSLHNEFPAWAKKAGVFSCIDMSDVKLSVDTIADFNRVKINMKEACKKIAVWESENGRNNTFKQ